MAINREKVIFFFRKNRSKHWRTKLWIWKARVELSLKTSYCSISPRAVREQELSRRASFPLDVTNSLFVVLTPRTFMVVWVHRKPAWKDMQSALHQNSTAALQGGCMEPGMSYHTGIVPSAPGHLRPPQPCIPLLPFAASSTQFQWAPLPSPTPLSTRVLDPFPKGPCWSTHEKRGGGKDLLGLGGGSMEGHCDVGNASQNGDSSQDGDTVSGLSRCPILWL